MLKVVVAVSFGVLMSFSHTAAEAAKPRVLRPPVKLPVYVPICPPRTPPSRS